eukprot:CAMPEP_0116047262 /NCGR_PEP_ID=MMETSP0321-20121206/28765_1 /TAXON_ID=163516 /ORGANISM="Leptocylindrus danicus var. danicus, Strain B650" /LENGTH=278 /DNA_ID=CAMNT_0003529065 /DNA_START=130 /DNA_END=966 /DNA_ORIENTATION=+
MKATTWGRRSILLANLILSSYHSRLVQAAFAVDKSVGGGATRRAMSTNTSHHDIPDPVVELGLPSPIILGSGSFTRKLILSQMGIKYDLVVLPIDEKNIGDRTSGALASELVSTLAKAKGDHVVQQILNGDPSIRGSLAGDEWVVLTGDQVVVQANSILEKPESVIEAKSFVKSYGLSAPRTVGACVLTHIPSMVQVSGVDTAQINFKKSISESADDLVDRLLDSDAPILSCAGGLMVEHPFVKDFIDGIDGTEDSVMGLSKDLVLRLLGELKAKLVQ